MPLIAAASPPEEAVFKGAVTGDENSKLTFKVIKNRKGRRRVDYPKARQLNAQCDSGPQEIDVRFGSPEKAARVSEKGAFNFDNSSKGFVVYVRGAITGKFASGVLRYQGPTDFGQGTQNCDSGEVQWTAKKRLS